MQSARTLASFDCLKRGKFMLTKLTARGRLELFLDSAYGEKRPDHSSQPMKCFGGCAVDHAVGCSLAQCHLATNEHQIAGPNKPALYQRAHIRA